MLNATNQPLSPVELELEIGAFMGPHIKRARIVLVVMGMLYALMGYLAYRDVSAQREAMREWGASDPNLDLAYAIAIGFIVVAGIGNLVLAAVAGKHTMPAFYAAAAIFVVLSSLQIYATDGLMLVNPPWSVVWWLSAICLGLGFHAALKAHRMRMRSGPPRAIATARS